MCNLGECSTCSSHPTKINLDFLDIFVEVFSVVEERELDRHFKEEGV